MVPSFLSRVYIVREGGVLARKAAVYGLRRFMELMCCSVPGCVCLRVPPINVRLSTGQPGWRRLGIRYYGGSTMSSCLPSKQDQKTGLE